MKNKVVDSLFVTISPSCPAAVFALLLGLLVLAPLPAFADADKYGSDLAAKPLPIVLGVKLSSLVSAYSDLVNSPELNSKYNLPVYQRQADSGKTLEGVRLDDVLYFAREDRVRGISARLSAADADKLKPRLDEFFGPSRLKRDFSFKWPRDGFVIHLNATEEVTQRQLLILWDPGSKTPHPGAQTGDLAYDTWGDPDVQPPVIGGVALGEKVGKYPHLKPLSSKGSVPPGVEFFGGADGELQDREFEGARLKNLSFTAYKGVIFLAACEVSDADGDKLVEAFKGRYFLPERRRGGELFWDVYEFEVDMTPIPGKGLRDVVFMYRPVNNQIIKDTRGDAPITVNGVILGDEIKNYGFLSRRQAMPYGIDYYTNPSPKPLFGVNIEFDSYGVFKGRIVTATFNFAGKDLPAAIKGLIKLYGPPDAGDATHYYSLNLGDVEVKAFIKDGNGVVDYVHSPLKWASDRAVDKYNATHKQ